MVAERLNSSGQQAAPALLTAEQYLVSGQTEGTELIDGRIVEVMPPGAIHGALAAKITTAISNYLSDNALGCVYVEAGYILQRNPDTVRAPDVSFLQLSQVPHEEAVEKFLAASPTVAVEVKSPRNSASGIAAKTRLYLKNGTQLVWIVDWRSRSVTVVAPGADEVVLGEGDTLTGGQALPGFELQLSKLFS